MVAFEVIFVPLLTLVCFAIAIVSTNIIINKKSLGGLISDDLPVLYLTLSSANNANVFADITWSNRSVIVSIDSASFGTQKIIQLFDANLVPDGTTIFIMNSAASIASGSVVISQQGLSVCLGRGQGITVVAQRDTFCGAKYVGTGNTVVCNFPEVAPVNWVPFQNYAPNPGLVCSSFNEVVNSSSSDANGPGCIPNFTLAPSGNPNILSAPVCASAECICNTPSINNDFWCNVAT